MSTDPTREDVGHGLGPGLDHVHIPVPEAVGLVLVHGLVHGRGLGPNQSQNSFPLYESLVRQHGGHLDRNQDRTAIRNVVPGQTISLPAVDQDPEVLRVTREAESIAAAVVVMRVTAKL